jgi:hypothetical protein
MVAKYELGAGITRICQTVEMEKVAESEEYRNDTDRLVARQAGLT